MTLYILTELAKILILPCLVISFILCIIGKYIYDEIEYRKANK